MARTNKYTSINFNHIYDKPCLKNPNNSSTSNNNINNPTKVQPFSHSSSRTRGRMLVLTRPSPKPVSFPISNSTPSSSSTTSTDRLIQEPDRISLRPLDRSGDPKPLVSSPVIESPKPDKFVPPHLRPGFVGREEKPGPEVYRGKESGQRVQNLNQLGASYGSPGQFGGEKGRPKSGGNEKMRKGGELDLGFLNRPRSSGNRPNSSG